MWFVWRSSVEEKCMGNVFAGSEIIKIGIEIEKNGKDFYTAVLGMAKNEGVKKVFKYLADQEVEHEKIFEGLLKIVEKNMPEGAYTEEYFAYLRALSEEHIFTKKGAGLKEAKKMLSMDQAVKIGIKAELESISFYEGAKKVVPEKDHEIINKIIYEEHGHLIKLLNIKKDYGELKNG